MKNLILTTLAVLSFCQFSQAQATDSLNSQLIGYWELKSVKFSGPVDINRDGKKSANAMDEYSDCQKDIQMELSEDMTARIFTGAHGKDCKVQEDPYKWRVVKSKTRDSKYVNGKRFVTDRNILVLVLRTTGSSGEDMQMIIEDVSKKSLTVKSELRDGSDSTSEAEVVYKRKQLKIKK